MHPTEALFKRTGLRRLALTTKQGPHNYYKGNRTGSMGRHTKYGTFVVEFQKVRTYVCPDLSTFYLTPFVGKSLEKAKDDFRHTETKSAIDGKEYLKLWKERNGED